VKLAIENLSPLPGKAIFWNNFHVVTRATIVMVAFSYAFGTLLGILKLGLPIWTIYAALVVALIVQFRITEPIAVGISMRRLRYNGTLIYARLPEDDPRKSSRGWITDIPRRFRRTTEWLGDIKPKIDEALRGLPDSADRVTLFLGKDADGNYAAKVYHACALSSCEDFSKHLRAYDEARDGVVNWGGL
jgi:hypothetical protein